MMKKKLAAFLTSLACLSPCLFSISTVSAEETMTTYEMVVVGVDDAENPQNYVLMKIDDFATAGDTLFYLRNEVVETNYPGSEPIEYGDILIIPDSFATDYAGIYELGFFSDSHVIAKAGTIFSEDSGEITTAEYTASIVDQSYNLHLINDEYDVYYNTYFTTSYQQPGCLDWAAVRDGDIVTMRLYKDCPILPLSITPLGDANLDGSLDVLDVIVLNRNIMGLDSLPGVAARSTDFGQADFNGDGAIDGSDSLGVMKRIVGLE